MDDTDAGNAEALRGFVAERDVPCPACGYNLRGITGRCCPECGLELRLGVQLGEPAMGALMLTLAGLFGLAGASGAMVLGILWIGALWDEWAPSEVWVVPVLGLVAGGTGAAKLASRRGRVWYRKRCAAERWAYAGGAWAGGAGAFLAFMLISVNL
jgi:hypothetical protein